MRDAIELIALNFETGQAAAVGIPRDTVVEFDGGRAKINAGLPRGGAQLMADKVAELTGVQPQYVVTTGLAGFQALVDSVGGLRVDVGLHDQGRGARPRHHAGRPTR